MRILKHRKTTGLVAMASAVALGLTVFLVLAQIQRADAQREPVELHLTGYGYQPPLEMATQDAVSIVEGTVSVAGPAQWSNIDGSDDELVGRERWDAVSRIVTPYEIKVTETHKGPERDSIIVWQIGGEVDGDRLVVDQSIVPVADGERGLFYVYEKETEPYLEGIGGAGDGVVLMALITDGTRSSRSYLANQERINEARSIAQRFSDDGAS